MFATSRLLSNWTVMHRPIGTAHRPARFLARGSDVCGTCKQLPRRQCSAEIPEEHQIREAATRQVRYRQRRLEQGGIYSTCRQVATGTSQMRPERWRSVLVFARTFFFSVSITFRQVLSLAKISMVKPARCTLIKCIAPSPCLFSTIHTHQTSLTDDD